MSELAAMLAAIATLLTPIGAAIGFIWHKVEKRMAEIERKATACEDREDTHKARIDRLTFETRRDGMALRLALGALHDLDGGNPALVSIVAILRTQYSPELALPEDMADLLADIEKGDHRHAA